MAGERRCAACSPALSGSEIRGGATGRNVVPGFAALGPGYAWSDFDIAVRRLGLFKCAVEGLHELISWKCYNKWGDNCLLQIITN